MIPYDLSLTCRRAKGLLQTVVRPAIYTDHVPLDAAIYQCPDPIPHDQAVRQAYEPVSLGDAWGPKWSTAWFRLRGRVPAGWREGEFRLLFDTGTEALCWWEGAPYQGVELHRQDVRLPASVEPGTDVEVFVEAACNHMLGVSNLYGDGERMGEFPLRQQGVLKLAHLARYHADRAALGHDLEVAINLAEALPADAPARRHVGEALRHACNALRPAELDASLPEVRQILADCLHGEPAGSASSVTCIGHAHIDLAWLWPIRETRRKAARSFSTVLRYMERHPEYHFIQSQAQLYEWIRQDYPALFEAIRERVREGRWEAGGAMWVEADCNIPSGESLVRQILLGTRYWQEHFGVEQRYLWLPDVFGYSAALPQLLKLAGLDAFFTQKISWNQFNRFPHHSFRWVGIDGTSMPSHFLPADTYNGTNLPRELLHGERNYKQSAQCPHWLHAFGYGDGGGGPTEAMIERADRLGGSPGMPRVHHGRVDTFVDRLLEHQDALPQWHGELYLEMHRGTYTTQARNKRFNRLGEQLLHDVELAQSLAGRDADERAETDRLWKLLLLNQFHDIIPGSSITWVYRDSQADYDAIMAGGQTLLDAAMSRLAPPETPETPDAPDTPRDAWVVLNPSGRTRGGVIELRGDAGGLPAGAQAQKTRDLEGDEATLLHVPSAPPLAAAPLTPAAQDGGAPALRVEGLVLENEHLRVELDRAGRVVSLVSKSDGREALRSDEPANQLVLYEDRPMDWDAWDVDVYYLEQGRPFTDDAEEVRVVEQGPVRVAIEFHRPVGRSSRLVQRVQLAAGSRLIEFDTRVDWREDHRFLRVLHPVDVHADHATHEIQFGHVRRPNHFNTSWDYARFEVAAQRWMDLSEPRFGVTLVNDCKYGHSCHGHVMGLSLLRSPKSPDPEADMGVHRFRYALMPHGEFDAAEAVAAAEQLNRPLRARRQPTPRSGAGASLVRVEGPWADAVVVDTVKPAEDGEGLIVRLYECRGGRGGVTLRFPRALAAVRQTDLLERPLENGLDVQGVDVVALTFGPFQIQTLRLIARA